MITIKGNKIKIMFYLALSNSIDMKFIYNIAKKLKSHQGIVTSRLLYRISTHLMFQ